MAKQIAVWGTPESGKTVLATKLALELTEMGKRVAVVYTDDRAPVLPMLFPGTRAAREYSVGAVLERVLMTPYIPINGNQHILNRDLRVQRHLRQSILQSLRLRCQQIERPVCRPHRDIGQRAVV